MRSRPAVPRDRLPCCGWHGGAGAEDQQRPQSAGHGFGRLQGAIGPGVMTRDVVKPRFEDAQVVMICHHLYERATRGLLISWHSVRWERFTPAKLFTREDGTEGKCSPSRSTSISRRTASSILTSQGQSRVSGMISS